MGIIEWLEKFWRGLKDWAREGSSSSGWSHDGSNPSVPNDDAGDMGDGGF